MSSFQFFMVALVVLCPLYLWIGCRQSNKILSSEDYFLMGRKLNFIPLAFTLLATQVGGGTLLGATQEAYSKGWFVLFYPLGMCLGLLILAFGFGGKVRKLGVVTLAAVFEEIYASRPLRYVASLLSVISLFFVLVAHGIAVRTFFAALGNDSPVLVIGMWSVLVAYTVMGGLKAVVETDVVQAAIIVVGLALTFFFINGVPDTEVIAISLRHSNMSGVPWVTWLFMPMIFMLIEQDMAQRCLAARNNKTLTAAAVSAASLLMCCALVAIYIGVRAGEAGLVIPEGSSVLIEGIRTLTNPFVSNVLMVVIFMAIISTADSILCSISSNIACDFLLLDPADNKHSVLVCRVTTMLIGIGALILSYQWDNVVTVLMASYELSVSVLAVPLIAAILAKKPSRLGALLAMCGGTFSFVVLFFAKAGQGREILTLGISLTCYFLGQCVTASNAKKEDCYAE